MDWALIRSTLQTVVSTALGGAPVRWAGVGATSGWASAASAELMLRSLTISGRDEDRWTYNGDGTITRYVFGNRTLNVQIKVETNAQTLEDSAHAQAEAVVLALYGGCADLSAANLGLGTVRTVRSADYCDCDGRQISAVILEAAFNTTSYQLCETIDRIEKTTAIGTVLHSDGTEAAELTIVAEVPDPTP